MNQFGSSGTHWPRGSGFPDEPIHAPAAIIVTGDLTHGGDRGKLGAYRLLYEQNHVSESTNYPVLPGLGNHDTDVGCDGSGMNSCARRMFDYIQGHVLGGVTNFDTGSDNYSWDWNGVHYVELNKWAGDTSFGYSSHNSGLP